MTYAWVIGGDALSSDSASAMIPITIDNGQMSKTNVFAIAGEVFTSLTSLVLPDVIGRTYTFLEASEFANITHESVAKSQEIYWREILYRAHWAAAASLLRHSKWHQACQDLCKGTSNFIGFCSCLRGLLESAADASYSLANVPLTIAENHKEIRKSLAAKNTRIFISPDIEDTLIHFLFARKPPKEAGGDVLVRLNRHALPLFNEAGKRLDVLKMARKLKSKQPTECSAWVQGGSDRWIEGRLVIVRRSKKAAELARKRLRQRASRKQQTVSEKAIDAAQYFFAWTTLPAAWSQQQILDLYRCRWQIELAFKRMKSIMGMGHLPKSDPESCRAWLHGKLFASLLVERMIGSAKKLSPWGYELAAPTEQMA